MYTLNRIEIIGHVGSDPELRHTRNEKAVAQMSVATNDRWKDASGTPQTRTEWHRVICWGDLAHAVAKHLAKGAFVRVVGRLQTRQFENKDGANVRVVEIIASEVGFLDRKPGADSHSSAGADRPDLPEPDEASPF